MLFRVRLLIAAVVVAALGWSAWWWIGASAQRAALEGWLEARRADGWTAEADALRVGGYPNRFDAVLSGLRLADPRGGWAWEAPELRSFMLSYVPNRVILALPPRQTFRAGALSGALEADELRASAAVAPGLGLELERAVIEGRGLRLIADEGWRAEAARGLLALRRSPRAQGLANAYDAALELGALGLPRQAADALAGLWDEGASLDADMIAAFDAPLDRRAAEGRAPRLTHLRILSARAGGAALRLEAKGELAFDAQGRPEGRLDLRVSDWRAALEALRRAGRIAAADARDAQWVLSLLAGGADALEAPLRFASGGVFLGPLRLGPAPRLGIAAARRGAPG